MVLEPAVEPRLDGIALGAGQRIVGQKQEARAQRILGLGDLGDRTTLPAQAAVERQDEIAIAGGGDPFRPFRGLAGKRFLGGGAQRLAVGAVAAPLGHEAETLQGPDMLALDVDVAGRRDLCFEHSVLFEPSHEDACTPIDEAPRQALMKSIRQAILYRSRALLPMAGVGEPLRPICREGPCAYVGDAI
jgi:hypothetical protein